MNSCPITITGLVTSGGILIRDVVRRLLVENLPLPNLGTAANANRRSINGLATCLDVDCQPCHAQPTALPGLAGTGLWIIAMRHPVTWALTRAETRHVSLVQRVKWWLDWHEELFRVTGSRPSKIGVTRIEDFLIDPQTVLRRVFNDLQVRQVNDASCFPIVIADNQRQQLMKTHFGSSEVKRLLPTLECYRERIRRLGYDLTHPPTVGELLHRSAAQRPAQSIVTTATALKRSFNPQPLPESRTVITTSKHPAVFSPIAEPVKSLKRPSQPRLGVIPPPPKRRRKKDDEEVAIGKGPPREPFVSGKRRLRVGFLTPSLCMGGAERWMISLARHTDPARIEWVGTVLTPWGSSNPTLTAEMRRLMPVYATSEYVPDRHNDPSLTVLPKATEAIAAVAGPADVLLTWGTSQTNAVAARLGCPIVFVSHCSFQESVRVHPKARSQSHLVAVSHSALAAYSDVDRPRATVLHNGVESDRCIPTMTREAMRAEWGFEPHHRLIGYVGRPSPEKNPLAVAQAVRQLGGEYRGVYVGGGHKQEETYRAAVEIAGDAVKFIPPVEPIGNALAALDVFVLASPSEGFSLALGEAWLAGVPTVTTRVGAVPELEEKYGQLTVPVPVSPTPEQLAEAVTLALSDANREVVARAKQVMQDQYTATAMANRWCEYLYKIVQANSSPSE